MAARLHSRPAMSSTGSEAVPGIVPIDTRMGGSRMVTSAYLVRGRAPALVETGPTTSVDALTEGLLDLGVGPSDLAHVILTHIHLDHAGGVGVVSRRFPSATVWVHERGAPHLADPERLVSSVARVYGEERMTALFGAVPRTDPSRIRALDDEASVDLGDRRLTALYTPGHASHHVALVDSETGAVFTGDALGIHLPDVRVLRPATPPPDVDVEASVDSIRRIAERHPETLLFSHYGPVREAAALCELAARRLRRWAEVVRDAASATEDAEEIGRILDAATTDEWEDAPADVDLERARRRYELLSSMRIDAAGLTRYWRKRWEREGSGGSARSGAG
jgi:glyoxylase-like metal-dependent hydrolase (beta-lactamase superfamily II)